jgi:hypothetical protein
MSSDEQGCVCVCRAYKWCSITGSGRGVAWGLILVGEVIRLLRLFFLLEGVVGVIRSILPLPGRESLWRCAGICQAQRLAWPMDGVEVVRGCVQIEDGEFIWIRSHSLTTSEIKCPEVRRQARRRQGPIPRPGRVDIQGHVGA